MEFPILTGIQQKSLRFPRFCASRIGRGGSPYALVGEGVTSVRRRKRTNHPRRRAQFLSVGRGLLAIESTVGPSQGQTQSRTAEAIRTGRAARGGSPLLDNPHHHQQPDERAKASRKPKGDSNALSGSYGVTHWYRPGREGGWRGRDFFAFSAKKSSSQRPTPFPPAALRAARARGYCRSTM